VPGGCADSLALYYCYWCLHQEKDTRVGIGAACGLGSLLMQWNQSSLMKGV